MDPKSDRMRILIDTDIGLGSGRSDTDDGLALLYALARPELDVVGVTTVAGNVPGDVATLNLADLLERIGRSEVPLGRSAALPLRGVPERLAARWNGMAVEGRSKDARRIERSYPDSVDFILEALRRNGGDLTLVAIGPLTNLAVALLKDAATFRSARQIVLMGGSAGKGNVTTAAEFNVWCDPEAADLVFRSGVPITMFGLDVTTKVRMLPSSIAKWKRKDSPFLNFLHGACSAYMVHRAEMAGEAEPSAFYHDVMPLAWLADPSLFTVESCHVDVETAGIHTRGMTVVETRSRPGTKLDHHRAVGVDAGRFEEAVVRCIAEKYRRIE